MAVTKLRSDALRNRTAVLSAAAEIFSENGAEASVERVAERCGVGVGTIYRHFPSKDALIAAVMAHRLERLAEMMPRDLRLRERDDVARVIIKLANEYVLKHLLIDYLARVGEGLDARSLPQMRQFLDALDEAVNEGRENGVLRRDVTADDFLTVIIAAAQSARSERLIALIVTGLAPHAPV